MTDKIEDNEVNILDYNIGCNAENRNTEGVVLFVREDIKYELVNKKVRIQLLVCCDRSKRNIV